MDCISKRVWYVVMPSYSALSMLLCRVTVLSVDQTFAEETKTPWFGQEASFMTFMLSARFTIIKVPTSLQVEAWIQFFVACNVTKVK